MRTGLWTYGVHYAADGSGFECELYDNRADPDQMVNLLHEPWSEIRETWRELHARLTATMSLKRATPGGFDWPEDPTQTRSLALAT